MNARSLFGSQQFATAAYRTELAGRLQDLGYEVERGKHGQPEIKGYSQEYLEASSPRRGQIRSHLEEIGREGAGAVQVAAHRTRDAKEIQAPAEVLHRYRELAAQFGHQAIGWCRRPSPRRAGKRWTHPSWPSKRSPMPAVTSSSVPWSRMSEPSSNPPWTGAWGRPVPGEVRTEFDRRAAQGEFRTVKGAPGAAGEQYTTAAMLRMEREIIMRMQEGNKAALGNAPLTGRQIRTETIARHPEINQTQRMAAYQIFLSQETIIGLDGVAGAGKTTTLSVIREGVEANGYTVEGFAPTSRAAQQLSRAGIETSTFAGPPCQRPACGHRREEVLCPGRELACLDQTDARFRKPPASQRSRSPCRRHPAA